MVELKFLTLHGASPFQRAPWSLPTLNDDGSYTPGEWMPKVEVASGVCVSGWHLSTEIGLFDWMTDRLYVAEGRGDRATGDDTKVAYSEARLLYPVTAWHEPVAPSFIADALLSCWPNFLQNLRYGKRLAAKIGLALELRQFDPSTGAALYRDLCCYGFMRADHRDFFHRVLDLIWGPGYSTRIVSARLNGLHRFYGNNPKEYRSRILASTLEYLGLREAASAPA